MTDEAADTLAREFARIHAAIQGIPESIGQALWTSPTGARNVTDGLFEIAHALNRGADAFEAISKSLGIIAKKIEEE